MYMGNNPAIANLVDSTSATKPPVDRNILMYESWSTAMPFNFEAYVLVKPFKFNEFSDNKVQCSISASHISIIDAGEKKYDRDYNSITVTKVNSTDDPYRGKSRGKYNFIRMDLNVGLGVLQDKIIFCMKKIDKILYDYFGTLYYLDDKDVTQVLVSRLNGEGFPKVTVDPSLLTGNAITSAGGGKFKKRIKKKNTKIRKSKKYTVKRKRNMKKRNMKKRNTKKRNTRKRR